MDFHRRLNIILEREEDDTDAIGTVAIFRRHNGDLQVLVTKRELPPSAGSWTLPGGHVKKGEKPVDGAKREIQEETGLTISKPTFVKTQKAAAGRGRVEFIFTVTASGSSKVNSGSDSRSLKWVNVNALPRLAFSHTAAIHDAAVKLYGESYLKEYYLPRAVSICEDVSEGKKLKKTVQGILDQKHRDDSGLLIVFEGIDGVGKCFGRDTPVLMADGTTRMVQDVIVGDRVMGADSTPREVISLGRGREMMYRVTPERGDPYVVNESHILSLEIRDGDDDKFADHPNRNGSVVNISVRDYLKLPHDLKQRMVGYRRQVEFRSGKTINDPYTFGTWLGDKSRRNEIVHERVPQAYKTNSSYTRLELLASLLDSCGSTAKDAPGCVKFVSRSKRLADDVAWLARSVGLAGYVSASDDGYYVTDITGNIHIIPVRKLQNVVGDGPIDKRCLQVSVNVEPIGPGDYYGFTITGDHLFLLGDFTVVHNTTQSQKLVDWLESQGYAVTTTKWNSSKLLKKAIDKAKDKRMLSPVLYCLLHAADMMVRYQEDILPALSRNEIVVCDRYWYTSAVRDQARGIDKVVADNIYKDIREPDLLLHCTCPIEVAFSRLLGDKGMSFYGSGMDLHLSPSKEENCIKFYSIMDGLYHKVLPGAKNYESLSMNRTIDAIFSEVKKVMATKFGIGKYTRS